MRRGFVGIGVLAVMSMMAPARAEKTAPDIVGHWNVLLGEPAEQRYCWLGVEQNDEGVLTAEYNARVAGIQKVEQFDYKDGKVKFTCWNWSLDVTEMVGQLKDGKMVGTAVSQKGKGEKKWVATRVQYPVDVTGRWRIDSPKDCPHRKMFLVLKQEGQSVEGSLINKGISAPVSGGTVDPCKTTFKAHASIQDHQPMSFDFSATVKGDVMEGQMASADKSFPFTATRKRKWGKPIQLFNGKNLDGWRPKEQHNDHPSYWKVVDGIMVNEKRGADLVYDGQFMNFKLHVLVRFPEGGNSGVYLRKRYEVQVVDSHGKEGHDLMGSIYSRIIADKSVARPAGQWQTLDVTLVGNYVTVILNDVKVIDNEWIEGITGGALNQNDSEPDGIFIQGDHSPVQYKEIVLTPSEEPQ